MKSIRKKSVKDGRVMIPTSVKDEALVQKKREQICRAALQAFTKHGFHETNLRQVTKLAGLAYGSIYDYVESKDDILFLIYDSILSELYHRLEEAAKSSDDPVTQVKALLKAAMDHTDEYQDAILLLYQESRVLKTSGHLAEVFEKERSYLRIFAGVLERGSRLGVFNLSNVRIMVNMIPLMCSAWALKRWNLKHITKEEYTESLTQFILQGIGASSKADAGAMATALDGKGRKRERKLTV
ncbi:MAG TPA: TetR/AcrR family transcriptional regulator [Blastocatellia bacterium]|nr:TetR/AcrR family transcriptional regulator [Blastocatellia bacterium]